MSTFPTRTLGTRGRHRGARAERYAFQVGGRGYTLQFLRMTGLEDYNAQQHAAVRATTAYEVSFQLEAHVRPDGTLVAGHGITNTGRAFEILGGVANGILDWARERQPDFLFWFAHEARRQRLYERMIRSFAALGSGWHRLAGDPFTGVACRPEAFWLGRLPTILPPDPIVLPTAYPLPPRD